MGSRSRSHTWLRAALVALVILAAAVMALMPPLIDFGVAVALAVGWCVWLDQRPTSQPTPQERGQDRAR